MIGKTISHYCITSQLGGMVLTLVNLHGDLHGDPEFERLYPAPGAVAAVGSTN